MADGRSESSSFFVGRFARGRIRVEVVEGRNVFGKRPFVEVIQDTEHHATNAYEEEGLDPSWSEVFSLPIQEQGVLVMRVLGEDDTGKRMFLGQCLFPVSTLKNNKTLDVWLSLASMRKSKEHMHQWLRRRETGISATSHALEKKKLSSSTSLPTVLPSRLDETTYQREKSNETQVFGTLHVRVTLQYNKKTVRASDERGVALSSRDGKEADGDRQKYLDGETSFENEIEKLREHLSRGSDFALVRFAETREVIVHCSCRDEWFGSILKELRSRLKTYREKKNIERSELFHHTVIRFCRHASQAKYMALMTRYLEEKEFIERNFISEFNAMHQYFDERGGHAEAEKSLEARELKRKHRRELDALRTQMHNRLLAWEDDPLHKHLKKENFDVALVQALNTHSAVTTREVVDGQHAMFQDREEEWKIHVHEIFRGKEEHLLKRHQHENDDFNRRKVYDNECLRVERAQAEKELTKHFEVQILRLQNKMSAEMRSIDMFVQTYVGERPSALVPPNSFDSVLTLIPMLQKRFNLFFGEIRAERETFLSLSCAPSSLSSFYEKRWFDVDGEDPDQDQGDGLGEPGQSSQIPIEEAEKESEEKEEDDEQGEDGAKPKLAEGFKRGSSRRSVSRGLQMSRESVRKSSRQMMQRAWSGEEVSKRGSKAAHKKWSLHAVGSSLRELAMEGNGKTMPPGLDRLAGDGEGENDSHDDDLQQSDGEYTPINLLSESIQRLPSSAATMFIISNDPILGRSSSPAYLVAHKHARRTKSESLRSLARRRPASSSSSLYSFSEYASTVGDNDPRVINARIKENEEFLRDIFERGKLPPQCFRVKPQASHALLMRPGFLPPALSGVLSHIRKEVADQTSLRPSVDGDPMIEEMGGMMRQSRTSESSRKDTGDGRQSLLKLRRIRVGVDVARMKREAARSGQKISVGDDSSIRSQREKIHSLLKESVARVIEMKRERRKHEIEAETKKKEEVLEKEKRRQFFESYQKNTSQTDKWIMSVFEAQTKSSGMSSLPVDSSHHADGETKKHGRAKKHRKSHSDDEKDQDTSSAAHNYQDDAKDTLPKKPRKTIRFA